MQEFEPRVVPAAFGVTTGTTPQGQLTYVIGNGADVQFSVVRGGGVTSTIHLGDVSSVQYKGQELLAPYSTTSRYSHYEQGLTGAAVVSYTIGGNNSWILVTADDSAASTGGVIQYYAVRKGDNNIYMAALPTDVNNGPGEGRFLFYLNRSVFSNPEAPSDNLGNDGAVEGSDVFHHPDGTTTSKFYNMGRRMIENVYHGLTGTAGGAPVGAWMFMGNREHSASGPFFKDIDFQSSSAVELYNVLFSGHVQLEPFRQGLQGPWAFQLTGGSKPTTPDYSWLETFKDGGGNPLISGLIPAAQRGTLTGTAGGVPTGHEVTVGLANTTAQYWGTPDAGGKYTINGIQAGTYTETLYDNELAVGTRMVTVSAGQTTGADITDTYYTPDPVFRIGTWDGTPIGFLNTDVADTATGARRIEIMHPSDVRMNSWTSTTNFVVGTNTDTQWPMAQFVAVNNGQRITFDLTAAQAAQAQTLRIGITLGFGGARNRITVNAGQSYAWTSPIPVASYNFNERGVTRGTWRGFNQLYTYDIPTSALRSGTNTIDLPVVSGSSGSGFLSPNVVYDAIDLVPTASVSAPSVDSISVSPSDATVLTNGTLTFTATAKDSSGNTLPSNVVWTAARGTINQAGQYVAPATTGPDTVTATYNGVSGSASVQVNDGTLTFGTLFVPSPTEGSRFSGTVATFTDANIEATAGDFSVTVQWGDGTQSTTGDATDPVTVTGSAGSFTVSGTHLYAEEGSNLPFKVQITDAGGGNATGGNAVLDVVDAPLTFGTVTAPAVVEGGTFSGTLATFSDANTLAPVSDFSVTVVWGDGSQSTTSDAVKPVQVTGSGGSFTVSGTHTYAEEGNDLPFSIQILDKGGSTTGASQSIDVADAPLTLVTLAEPSPTEGGKFSGTVATFTDANPLATTSDFSVTVQWGDGTQSTTGDAKNPLVLTAQAGGFTVSGTHTYGGASASATFSVQIVDVGGSTTGGSIGIEIADAPLTFGTLTPLAPVEGGTFSGAIATFKDADTSATPGYYSVTVLWGDGSSSTTSDAVNPVKVAGGRGNFTVSGTHFYAEEGNNLPFSVQIVDNGGTATGGNAFIKVADAPLAAGPLVQSGLFQSQTFTGVVAIFTDANLAEVSNAFAATINWGDGTSASAATQIRAHAGGGFEVLGSHRFTRPGAFSLSAAVVDKGGSTVTVPGTIRVTAANSDFDLNGTTDLTVFRPRNGTWYIARADGSLGTATPFGQQGDTPLFNSDFDGDGKPDLTIVRPNGSYDLWAIRSSVNPANVTYLSFGMPGDVPVAGVDMDGDGKADPTLFRPSTGNWFILESSHGPTSEPVAIPFGQQGDIPLGAGDFDADGVTDLAIFRPANGLWAIRNSTHAGSPTYMTFGQAGDVPIAGSDYDGDGKADLAIFRPSDGLWALLNSGTGKASYSVFGQRGDIPVGGVDLNGDGKADLAVFRPSNGLWAVRNSGSGAASHFVFGQPGDVPARDTTYAGPAVSHLATFTPATAAGNATWNIHGVGTFHFGDPGDVPVLNTDYDGDGVPDLAVFTPTTGTWRVRRSLDGKVATVSGFGMPGDVPIAGSDFDGDGLADIAYYRSGDGSWNILLSGTPAGQARRVVVPDQPGDLPLGGIDYNGDGLTDLVGVRPADGTTVITGLDGTVLANFSLPVQAGDRLVGGDFDGDGAADVAVFHAGGTWQVHSSSSNTTGVPISFGQAGDIPVPGMDYNGDGVADLAIFRPGAGQWFIETAAATPLLLNFPFGGAGDTPFVYEVRPW